MSRFRRVTVVVIALAVLVSIPVNACPYCKYSPNGWGFCRYGFYAGAYSCTDRQVDAFSGRTDCDLQGDCNWNAGGDPGDCGYTDINGHCLV